jgi:membrane protease YdiL (CAAX protease family)
MHEVSGNADPCCSGCGKTLRPGAGFCQNCGRTVKTSMDTPAVRAPSVEFSQPGPTFDSHWKELKQVGWLFALLLGSSLIAGTLSRFDASPWPGAIVSGIDALIVLSFAAFRFREIAPLLGRPTLDLQRALILALLALSFFAVFNAYFSFIKWTGMPIIRLAGGYEKAGWPTGSMFILVSLLPAFVEELAFRGVIQCSLERVAGERQALFIQAALFSVLHLSPMMFVSHFFMGLCFGYMRLRSKSLYPGMALHAAWNAFVLLKEINNF